MDCRLSASPDETNTAWKLYFKLYCFLDTDSVPKDSVEFAFMFEQVKNTSLVNNVEGLNFKVS